MREIIRISLRIGFILILLGGCVHNLYHFHKLTDRPYYHNRYNPSYGYSSSVNNTESVDEIEEVVVTPNEDSIYQDTDYNERRIRASSYRY